MAIYRRLSLVVVVAVGIFVPFIISVFHFNTTIDVFLNHQTTKRKSDSHGLPSSPLSQTNHHHHQQQQQQQQLFDTGKIPSFMMDYFEWHGQQLQMIQEDEERGNNDDDDDGNNFLSKYRFLILRCQSGKENTNNSKQTKDDRCGGLSDRIKTFPLFIWYAATTNRILFFYWGENRPASIETFLQPGPLWNWTVPNVLIQKQKNIEERNDNGNTTITNNDNSRNDILNVYTRVYFEGSSIQQNRMHRNLADQTVWMVEGNDSSGGAARYENFVTDAINKKISSKSQSFQLLPVSKLRVRDAIYANFYHDLFHATFRPSKGVESLLNAYFYDPKYDNGSTSENRDNMNVKKEKVIIDNLTYSASISMSYIPMSKPKSWLPIPLQRNQYAVAHYRAKYPKDPYRETQNRDLLRKTTIYGVECAKSRVSRISRKKNYGNTTHSRNNENMNSMTVETMTDVYVPAIYVASDTALVIEAVRDAYSNKSDISIEEGHSFKTSINIWTYLDLQTDEENRNDDNGGSIKMKQAITLAEDPPHLNFAKTDDMTDFYVVFVDLFLMSYAKCVVYGLGGFGRLGSLVSYHPRCGVPFTLEHGVYQKCDPYTEKEDEDYSN
mmetsp:Transcript_16525/g.18232  ORF Transcript_16525/g.18232 Transcript_16525/m.18232 type:complete len:609 (-) Transcript_16525:339-2165(-)